MEPGQITLRQQRTKNVVPPTILTMNDSGATSLVTTLITTRPYSELWLVEGWWWKHPFTNHNSPHSKLWPMLWQQNVSFDYLNIGRKLFVLFIKDDMTLLLTATWYSKLGCCFKTSCCCWGFFYKFLWRGTMSMPTTRWHNFSSSSPPTVTKQCIFLFLNNQYNHSMNAIREVKRKS